MKTMLLVIFLSVMTAVSVNANNKETEKDWAVKTTFYKTIAADSESIIQSGRGIQVSLHQKNIFLYLSKDKNQVRFAGQGGPDVDLWSAGVGMQHKLGKHLTLTVDIGWYQPEFRGMGDPQPYPYSSFAEGLCRYLNKFLIPDDGYPAWDYYTLEYKGGIGGKLGLVFEYPITKRLSFNVNAGYRYLKVQENIQGRHYLDHPAPPGHDWSKHYWTVRYDRDFSAFLIGGMLEYKF